ncbi:hypothetical protein TYRP_023398 [Tyrophagus putrescentiae]|nr:hypothetical protein TYRP_023398 [Tyrophagus putrescentiae]
MYSFANRAFNLDIGFTSPQRRRCPSGSPPRFRDDCLLFWTASGGELLTVNRYWWMLRRIDWRIRQKKLPTRNPKRAQRSDTTMLTAMIKKSGW